MNTKTLQKQFPEVYNQLFSQYELVLSGHFGFHRFPAGVSNESHYLSIKQKIESKCYVGIKKSTQPGIHFEDILMYDGSGFIKYDENKLKTHYGKSIEYLNEYFKTNNNKIGYNIFIIAESTRGEGLGFTGTLFSLIVSGLGILSGKYSQNIFNTYSEFEKSKFFKEIKDISQQCTREDKKGNIGPAIYTVMLETKHPHIYLSEDHKKISIEDIPHIQEVYQKIPEILDITDTQFSTLPVRRAMIYTGQRANTILVEQQKSITETKNKEYSENFSEQHRNNIKSHLHTIFSKHSYYEILVNTLDAMSAKTFHIFSNIYKHGSRKEYINELIHHLNTIHNLYNNIEGDYSFTNDITQACAENQISANIFGIMPIYTNINGGNYLVTFENDNDLQVLERILQKMEHNYPNIRIAHKYDFDNPPSQGIKIEQNIFDDKISSNDNDLYVLLDKLGNKSFINYSDINPTESDGLFLDAVRNKVYLNGIALTSKDIKSQTTTIEIFDLILQSKDFTIKNNQLGPSTFSGQQNQMLGKIIYPLNKLVEKETGKGLNLECTGSLREFWIKLGKTSITITLIKKI